MTRLEFLCRITAPAVELYYKMKYKVHYEGPLPQKGPCLLFAKHQTRDDQFLIGLFISHATRRHASYLMRKFVFPLNHVLQLYGGINVAREREREQGFYGAEEAKEKNRNAELEAIRVLKRGEPLVNFPEGTRLYKKMNTKFKLGIVRKILNIQKEIAQPYNLPGLPCSILGIEYEDASKKNSNVWLRAGEPFYVKNTTELEQRLLIEIPKLSGL